MSTTSVPHWLANHCMDLQVKIADNVEHIVVAMPTIINQAPLVFSNIKRALPSQAADMLISTTCELDLWV